METYHVVKLYRREHSATGVWEEFQSVFTSFDGRLAQQQARNAMQAIAFGFISDGQNEGAKTHIHTDVTEQIKVTSELNGATETIVMYLTDNPSAFKLYSRYSEHHEI